nr:hypothetical protein BaRGS_029574 [Batillaria attramentaria]
MVLHYLLLASFMWMLVEGLLIYLKLVVVSASTSALMPYFFTLGYGVPLIVVIVSAGIYHQGYGTDSYCWLSDERGFIWSFQGPALFVITTNMMMLVLGITVMVRHYQSPSKGHMSQRDKMKSWIKGSATLVVLLGSCWVFGMFNMGGEKTVIFAYLFVITNSMQGLFIFIFHCLMNDKVLGTSVKVKWKKIATPFQYRE